MSSEKKPTNSNSEEASKYEWKEVTNDCVYESSYPEHQELARQHGLLNAQVFILDMVEDWARRATNPDQIEQFKQLKKDMLDDLEHGEFRLKGPL